jgi:Tol biopolymer transport system component
MSNRDGNREVYIMNSDGSSLKNLSNTLADEYSPVFSPDSSKIAFNSNRGDYYNSEVYIMNTDGGGLENLSNNARIRRPFGVGAQHGFVLERCGTNHSFEQSY